MVDDRWEVQFLLGVGELAEVYDVVDQKTRGSAVIKLFAPQFLETPAAWPAYQEYAERIRALSLPALVNPYAFGVHAASASPFSVAERVGAPALDQLVATVGTLLPAQFARVLRELAPLLDAAHRAGVIHRNLKPSNIFCGIQDPRGLQVSDTAVSALRRELAPYPGWGATPGWVAPEALDPRAPDQVTMDVYAVGLLAFFALTDRNPFLSLSDFDPDRFRAELNRPLPPMSARAREIGVQLDERFDAWFDKALALEPNNRFPSVGMMARELLELTHVAPPESSARWTHAAAAAAPKPEPEPAPLAAVLTPSIRAPAISADPGVASASVQPLVFSAELPRSVRQPMRASESPPMAPARAASPSMASPLRSTAHDRSRAVVLAAAGTGVIAVIAAAIVVGVLVNERDTERAEAVANTSPETVASEQLATATPSAAPAPAPMEDAATPPAASKEPEPTRLGKVKFDCSPVACDSVHCDGTEYTELGGYIELPAGEHRCIGSKSGYLPLITTFALDAGQERVQALELKEKVQPTPTPAPAVKKTTKKTEKQVAKPSGKSPCGTFINPCK